MIKQNDEKCLPAIQKIGCFFRSSLLAVEYSTGKKFTPDDLNSLWNSAKFKGIISIDDDLMDSAKLMNLGLDRLCEPGYFAEIGLKVAGHIELYRWAENAGLVPDTFIRKMRQGGPNKYHYVLVDEKDKLIEDPHDPVIKDLGEVFTICYKRIIK